MGITIPRALFKTGGRRRQQGGTTGRGENAEALGGDAGRWRYR